MNGYHIALFVHLVALVAAGAAAATTHLAEWCTQHAATVREARQWHTRAGKSARTFPIVIVLLLLSGGYMISRANGLSWRAPWVVEGVVASALLFVAGGVLSGRARAIGRSMAQLDADAPSTMHRDVVSVRLAWMNTGIAIATTFVMVTKPALAGSFIALAVGAVLGAVARSGRGAATITVAANTARASSEPARSEPTGAEPAGA